MSDNTRACNSKHFNGQNMQIIPKMRLPAADDDGECVVLGKLARKLKICGLFL